MPLSKLPLADQEAIRLHVRHELARMRLWVITVSVCIGVGIVAGVFGYVQSQKNEAASAARRNCLTSREVRAPFRTYLVSIDKIIAQSPPPPLPSRKLTNRSIQALHVLEAALKRSDQQPC